MISLEKSGTLQDIKRCLRLLMSFKSNIHCVCFLVCLKFSSHRLDLLVKGVEFVKVQFFDCQTPLKEQVDGVRHFHLNMNIDYAKVQIRPFVQEVD